MTQTNKTQEIKFWSGNRTQIRKDYEREILNAVLKATEKDFGSWRIQEDSNELAGDEESKAFTEKKYDLFVTIAGNQKFKGQDFYLIEKPLAKNLLGYRIPVVHQKIASQMHSEAEEHNLKQLTHGIPETWGDVQIFKDNGYTVLEKGNLDELFERLSNKEFDYTALGANEILSVFKKSASKFDNLQIVDEILFYYPLPLVFYVHPHQKQLSERIETGLHRIEHNGIQDSMFNRFYGRLIKDLNLSQRTIYYLKNPFIPEVFKGLKPDFERMK